MVRLKIAGISFSYPSIDALRDVSLTVESGEVLAIVGPNGSGKTTLLKCIAGLLKAKHGRIEIDGKEISSMDGLEIARSVAMLMTSPPETQQITVFDLLSSARYPYTGVLGRLSSDDFDEINRAAGMLGLGGQLDKRLQELSDGQRQRALIATVLARKTKVLLLDEPTSHLDLAGQVDVLMLIKRIARERGLAVVESLHDANLASIYSDKVALMSNGRIIAVGDPEEVLNEELIAKAYSLEEAIVVDLIGKYIIPKHASQIGKPVHVISCGKAGIPVYRILAMGRARVTSGILSKSDIDFYAARVVCREVVATEPFSEVDRREYEEALSLIEEAELVIDTGFPACSLTRYNVELAVKAAEMGKYLISLRKDLSMYGKFGERVEVLDEPGHLLQRLNELGFV